ncbi:MAG TPA: TetR family transcriptional regulator [Candidatus Binataceae bacterium]|nr:TetR family transcriptional regulator [Candidatus Binataceae bacterium]
MAQQRRDLERTREKILAAAASEFAAKGLAGARVDAIARRARVNKQMLYYCFGSKRELYRIVLSSKLTARTHFLDALPNNIEEALLHIFDHSTADIDFVRMLQWEALEPTGDARLVAQDERRALFLKGIEKFSQAQRQGFIPADVDPRHLLISFIACSVFPLAFRQMIHLLTGLEPTDPKFRRQRRQFLGWLGRRLADKPHAAINSHRVNGTSRASRSKAANTTLSKSP